jgi:hypothetical protein
MGMDDYMEGKNTSITKYVVIQNDPLLLCGCVVSQMPSCKKDLLLTAIVV